MNTHNDFCTYPQAVHLKKLGFDWECNYYYTTNEGVTKGRFNGGLFDNKNHNERQYSASAPSLSQAQKWLREVKNMEVVVEPRFSNYKRIGYDWYVYDDFCGDYALRAPLPFSPTHEAALSAGIDAALQILEENSSSN